MPHTDGDRLYKCAAPRRARIGAPVFLARLRDQRGTHGADRLSVATDTEGGSPVKRAVAILASGSIALSITSCLDGPRPTASLDVRPTSGIDRAAVAATAATRDGFYPLSLGNRWTYRETNHLVFVPTGGAAQPPVDDVGTVDVDMTCTQSLDGLDYSIEHSVSRYPTYTSESWIHYRQDRGGLYRADGGIFTPPPCAVSGPAARLMGSPSLADRVIAAHPSYAIDRSSLERLDARRAAVEQLLSGRASRAFGTEYTILRYPLRPGASWTLRDDLALVATVEALEVVAVPAGRFNVYRVRLDNPGVYGPNESVTLWYDRHGVVKTVSHFEGPLNDVSGNVIGTLLSDNVRDLTEWVLEK